MASQNKVLIYGARGGLGRVCLQFFKSKGWWICSVDMSENEDADCSVVVTASTDLQKQQSQVSRDVATVAGADTKFDAILCVAGGWAGGNTASKDFIKNCDLVMKQSIWTSVIAARLAATYLKESGLLQLTGAQAALGATPGMIGYGFAKAAVHQLVQSLAADKSGLPAGATALAILPITLDTPMNRKFMPDADHSTWTPLEFVAQTLFKWTSSASDRPASGSLIQLITKDGATELVPATQFAA